MISKIVSPRRRANAPDLIEAVTVTAAGLIKARRSRRHRAGRNRDFTVVDMTHPHLQPCSILGRPDRARQPPNMTRSSSTGGCYDAGHTCSGDEARSRRGSAAIGRIWDLRKRGRLQ